MKCKNCSGNVARGKDEVTIRVEGSVFQVAVAARICAQCQEVYVDAAELGRAELVVANHLAGAGIVSGPALRFMRKALGRRAADLASLLNVAPETLSRWESGERDVPELAFAVVGTLVRDRLAGRSDTEEMLRAIESPPPRRKKVRLEVA